MVNYVKFFKDILARWRRFGEFETIVLTQECNHMLQNKIPQKLKDLESFTIPCSIGIKYNDKAIRSWRCQTNNVTLQLANRSHAYTEGKIKDVLVKVDKFIFPMDFIVVDSEVDKEMLIILEIPFLAMSKTN